MVKDSAKKQQLANIILSCKKSSQNSWVLTRLQSEILKKNQVRSTVRRKGKK